MSECHGMVYITPVGVQRACCALMHTLGIFILIGVGLLCLVSFKGFLIPRIAGKLRYSSHAFFFWFAFLGN